MTSLRYLLFTTIKNWIKELRKKPGQLVLVLFVVAMFALMVVSTMVSDPTEILDHRNITELYAIIFVVYLFIFLFTTMHGFSSGGSFYSMADVHLLFSTPISSKKILLYGLVKQMGTSLFVGFFILFQYSWLNQIYGITLPGVLLILLGYAIIMFCGQLCAMILYSFTSGNETLKRILKTIFIVVGVLAIAYIGYPLLSESDDILGVAVAQVNSPVLAFFPVGGWIKAAIVGCLSGDFISVLCGFGGTFLFVALLIFILTKTHSDFYEDVLQATEVSFSAITAKKENKTMDVVPKNVKVGKSGLTKGWGASAFYFKHKIEKRRGRVFLFDTMTTIFFIITIVFSFFMKEIIAIFIFSVYMQFFSAHTGRWVRELTLPYVYMVPQSPFKKLFYVCLEGIEKIIIEAVLLFAIIGVVVQLPVIEVIVCIFARIGFGLLFIAGNFLTERLLGSTGNKFIILGFYFLALLIIIAPGLAIGGVVGFFLANTGISVFAVVLGISTVWNILMAGLIAFLCRNVLDCAEINNQ